MTELLKKAPEIFVDAEAVRLRELRQERRELGVLSHVLPSRRERRARLDAEIAEIRALRDALAQPVASETTATKEHPPGQLDTLRSRRDQFLAELSVQPTWKFIARSNLVKAIADIDRQTARVFNSSRTA